MSEDAPRKGPGSGRRWATQYWVQGEEGTEKRWVLQRPPGTGFNEGMEYRFVFDRDRRLWRVDARVYVPGG